MSFAYEVLAETWQLLKRLVKDPLFWIAYSALFAATYGIAAIVRGSDWDWLYFGVFAALAVMWTAICVISQRKP